MNQQLDSVTSHSIHSSYREKLIEHLFVGELLKKLWCAHQQRVECLRPEVDNGGYDIVLRCNDVVRFVQLKASRNGGKASKQNVNRALEMAPGGCVVWIWFDDDSLELVRFGFFGGAPGQPLPSLEKLKVAKHTKFSADRTKSQRLNILVIPKAQFTKLDTMEKLIVTLFGDCLSTPPAPAGIPPAHSSTIHSDVNANADTMSP